MNSAAYAPSRADSPLTYAWDLDNNGTFETSGQNVQFDPVALGVAGLAAEPWFVSRP